MRAQTCTRLAYAATLVATLLVPAAAAGQVAVVWSPEERARVRADELHARAEALYEDPRRYGEAALLLRQAARLRPAGDAASIDELMQSGRLFAYAGDQSAGRASMIQAADRALMAGDLITAAHALVDAAFLAVGQKKWGEVEQLSSSAERLAMSPHLSGPQRAAVLRRIDPAKLALADARR